MLPGLQVQTRASLNAALLGSAGAGVIIGLCSAAYSHAGPGKELSSYTHSLLPGIWSAYQGSVSAYPVVTKAALTGVTYVLGDMLAQAVELRHANREDGPAEERQLLAKASRRRGLLLQMDPSRYMRSGLIGLLLLGPLAHYYYAFVAAHLARWPLPCKIGLDQTLYLSLYNTVYYVSLGVLSCRPVRDVARVYQTQVEVPPVQSHAPDTTARTPRRAASVLATPDGGVASVAARRHRHIQLCPARTPRPLCRRD